MDGSDVLFSPADSPGYKEHRRSYYQLLYTFLTGVVVRGPRCARGEVVVIECCDGRQLPGAHHGHGSHVEMFGHPEQAGFKYQLKLKKEETTKSNISICCV